MTQTASAAWWNKSLEEVGLNGMDKHVAADSSWAALLASGRDDFARALSLTHMQTGRDRTVVEIGCGVGRISAVLAERFGRVIGVDVAPTLIEEARRRNERDNVSFEVCDGVHLRPSGASRCHTVFSYEVLYYLNRQSLTAYFIDTFVLLRGGGEFVFHLNMEPIRLTTRLSSLLRRAMRRCGIKHWRGWPTGVGMKRYYHSEAWLRQTLERVGFRVERIVGPTPRQKWIVAVKP
ncbi:MAG: class I SAM-dependent methyltransferase [Candidatus Saccharimonas sp.]|nr:class I SAM-dependent methyltransferase [Planctomycetaceae bacterium]